jgi:excisionase family DNA binding protein
MGWTTEEAAKYLDKSISLVISLIRRNKLSAKKHGRDWDIDPQSVKDYKNAPKNKGGRPRKQPVK